MLKSLTEHPAFRTGAVLVSVAVAGSLIGMGWEEAHYGRTATELERAEEAVDALDRESRSLERSKRDEAVLARTLTYFPPYPNMKGRPEALAADYLGPDVPIAVAYYETKDSSDQVLQHYRKFLLDKGLPVIGRRFNANSGYVGYWSPDTEEVRLMSTLRQGDETVVFVSTGQMARYLERDPQIPAWAPVPRGLQDVASLALRMEGATNLTVTGRMADMTLPEAERGYRESLGASGWTVSEGSSEGFQTKGLTVTREGLRGQATLRQPSAQRNVEFHLSLMRTGEAAP